MVLIGLEAGCQMSRSADGLQANAFVFRLHIDLLPAIRKAHYPAKTFVSAFTSVQRECGLYPP